MKFSSIFIKIFLILFLLGNSFLLFSQIKIKDQHVFLLSNIESLTATSLEFDALEKLLKQEQEHYTVLITGDFVKENEFDGSLSLEETAKLDRLIALTKKNGRVVFIPGDLEWNYSQKKGWKKVLALEKYLESKLGEGEAIFPQSACLGPEILNLGKSLRIATINSQWFVQKDNRPEVEDAACDSFNERAFWDELEDIMSDTDNRNLIVAFHHPALSYGQYAGYKLTKQHFTPPIYGSFKTAFRQNIGNSKDLNNEAFKLFSNKLLAFAKLHPGIIFVSGHENDLQIIFEAGNYHINSGAFAKSKPVAKGVGTIYRQQQTGFSKLIFKKNGAVNIEAFTIKNGKEISKSFEQMLYSSPCLTKSNNIPTNNLFNPCPEELVEKTEESMPASGSATAGAEYKAGILNKLILGKNYRNTWTQQVNNIPYLDLEKTAGGLKPYAKGGAGQTISLKFKSEDGQRFSFRSVNKNPTKKLGKDLKQSVYGKITQELTSLQYPYGSLLAGSFMDKLGLPHSMAKLYLMPDSPILGSFREEFAGRYGSLELKPKGKKKKRAGFKDADKVVSTFQMYQELLDDNDNKIDVAGYVTSRILDIWISDWDRHENNWKWLGYKTDKGMFYKPFPKDRDKAFYIVNGVLRVSEWDFITKDLGVFKKKYRNLKSGNFKAKSMDRWLPNTYTREDWQAEAKRIQSLMTAEAIDEAIATLPAEVQPISGPRIKSVLQARRKNLVKAIDKYYLMVAKYFDLVGSNKSELFEVTRLKNGDVRVEIYKLSSKGNKKDQLLNRVFKKNETKEIRLHGLGNQDVFKISGEAASSILIRIVSGDGVDTIEDTSKVRSGRKLTCVYDKRKKDKVTLNSEVKMMKTPEIITFETDKVFAYNYSKLLPSFSFNADDGFSFGIVGGHITQGFNKPDFKSNLTFSASATTEENYDIVANLTLRHLVKKWDMVSGIALSSNDRSFDNFYGLGNDSELDDSLDDLDYYRNRMESAKTFVGLKRQFWQKSSLTSTLQLDYRFVESYTDSDQDNSIYDQLPAENGVGNSTLLGPNLELNLDFTDNATLPKKGMKLNIKNFTFFNKDLDWDYGGKLEMEATTFFTRGIRIPATLSLRGGFVHSYNKTPFFYKSYLGQQENLRGFLRNRYGGDTAAFLNSDLRLHFGKVINRILPFEYGVFGIFDMGRVWVSDENSNGLHSAFGAGIYLIPYVVNFNMNLTVTKSSEHEVLYSFRVGFFLK